MVFVTIGALAYVKNHGSIPAIVVLHLGALTGITYAWRVRPDQIRVSLASAVLFPLVYFVLLVATELVLPTFLETQWSGYATFRCCPFGVPIDEFLYAALFGAGCSVVYETGASIVRGFQLSASSMDG